MADQITPKPNNPEQPAKPIALAKTASNNLGIDNLKIVIGFILYVAYQLAEMMRRFEFSKAIQIAFYIGENLDILRKGKQALAELRDLTQQETAELIDFFGVNFDLADDSLELRIEKGLQFIPEGYALLKQNINFYLRVKDWVKSWGQTEEAIIARLPEKINIAA